MAPRNMSPLWRSQHSHEVHMDLPRWSIGFVMKWGFVGWLFRRDPTTGRFSTTSSNILGAGLNLLSLLFALETEIFVLSREKSLGWPQLFPPAGSRKERFFFFLRVHYEHWSCIITRRTRPRSISAGSARCSDCHTSFFCPSPQTAE